MRLWDLLIAVAALFSSGTALAHPHVWVDTAAEVRFNADGYIEAIRHHWRFDEGFSAYALQGLDVDGDGLYSTEELKPLARANVDTLSPFGYFTFLTIEELTANYEGPTDYQLDYDGTHLTLHYTLALSQPVRSKTPILLEVFDPDYYIAFSLPSAEAVRLFNAPTDCQLTVTPAKKPNAAAAQALAAIGPDQRDLPEEMQALTEGVENSAEIACGEARAIGPTAGADAGSAAATAEPASAAGKSPSISVMARIAALQNAFGRNLTEALKTLKDDGAFWWLGGISFLYGIIHAAGPGHGKVVISSYLLANEQTVRRGVLIAFLAAFVQAIVAVAIIGVMAAALDMTSSAITGAAKVFEAGSFALVAVLGLYLLARKSRQLITVLRSGDPHCGHSHNHHPGTTKALSSPWPFQIRRGRKPASLGAAVVTGVDDDCLSHHAVDDNHGAACLRHNAVKGHADNGRSGAIAAVLSVGIRPCSGARVILVLALAHGIFWAGIASTFLMALGTALTVAVLAAIAVGAKDIAVRLSAGDGRRSAYVMLALELVAALFISALGFALLIGTLSF